MKVKYKVLIVIIILAVIGGSLVFILGGKPKEDKQEETKVVDNMESFSYTLDDRDTEYMKTTFKELKDLLTKKDIDNEEYAKILTKLFIIDFFTLSNKKTKYDVGSLEYVYPDSVDNFKLNAEDTLYKIIKTTADSKKNQELPVVKEVDITSATKGEYKIGEETFDAYVVKATWEYEKDLGYDKKATITSVLKDKKLYVVEYKTGE